MDGMRPSPQSVLRTRLDMGRRVSGKVCRISSGKGRVDVPVCQKSADMRPRVAVHVHEDGRLFRSGLAAILANSISRESARVVTWHRLLNTQHLLSNPTLCALRTAKHTQYIQVSGEFRMEGKYARV